MECVTCKIKSGEPIILCDSCQRPSHKECSGLNASELKVMDLKGKRVLRFYCEDCQNGVRLIPKLLVKIDNLEAEINKLKDLMESGNKSSGSLDDKEDVICEMLERQNRASNIIVFHVNESKMKLQQERDAEDGKAIEAILNNFNVDKSNLKMFRLGKFLPNKIRPIKIILKSPEDAKFILKNKQLNTIPSVRIYGDQTKAQRDYFNAIKAKLQSLIEKGDNKKTIKFINNRPTIVDKQDPKNQM